MLSNLMELYARRDAAINALYHHKKDLQQAVAALNEISAADTVEEMIEYHIGRCHQLTEDRKGEYAVDLVHPYRLVFTKKGEEIQIARIMEIVDYH